MWGWGRLSKNVITNNLDKLSNQLYQNMYVHGKTLKYKATANKSQIQYKKSKKNK